MTLVCVKGERRFKFNKIPRIDTNEVSEIEVTVTTVRHVQAEREINSRQKTAAGGGLDKGWDTKDGFDVGVVKSVNRARHVDASLIF